MVSRSQAAEFLGVTPQALSQMDARGEGPPFARIGRSIRYRREDLLDWIESRTVRR
jgi:predicted DNA-binding transcriptional regulator AlpA